MPTHFSRSLRKLEADGFRRSVVSLGIIAAFLGLWAGWFVMARVAIYATTGTARLEVDQESHPVEAPVGGRVTLVRLAAGTRVQAGDVLVELDANPERLAQTEERAKLAPAAEQLRLLKDELRAQELALDVERRSAEAANAESQARAEQSESAADLAQEESRRLSALHQSGLVSEMEALRGRKLAEERQGDRRAADFAASRLARDLDAKEQDRLAAIAGLRNQIAAIEGTRSGATAASNRLDYEIERRLVRAPVAGTIAEVSPLKVGGIVQPGDRICTLVPDGALKVVALFAPSVALGRVHDGQIARVRLEGFPWTQYGTALARVARVSGELRDGQVRVELALSEPSNSAIPFQHGLPAEVDVEIERISPLAMVRRTIGDHLRVSAASRSPEPNAR